MLIALAAYAGHALGRPRRPVAWCLRKPGGLRDLYKALRQMPTEQELALDCPGGQPAIHPGRPLAAGEKLCQPSSQPVLSEP